MLAVLIICPHPLPGIRLMIWVKHYHVPTRGVLALRKERGPELLELVNIHEHISLGMVLEIDCLGVRL